MGDHPNPVARSAVAATDTTPEELLAALSRITANEPHVQCRVGEGPLGPVAAALNTLATHLSTGRLKASEAFGIHALVSQAPNMMLACDLREQIRFLNFTLPGRVLGDVVGLSVMDFVAPAEQPRVRGIIRKVVETGVPTGYEIRSIVQPGPEWFSVRVGPIKAGHETIGFTMIFTDISDLKRTHARLEHSNRELESFAYVASHDLQEPLRKIQTFGDRLKATSADALGPKGLDYLERMNAAATRMRGLIDDLLSYARVSAQTKPFTRVDLAALAREVLGDLETAIERTGATITLGELPVLDADPVQLRQLLQNLLSNALKFRREDEAPTISVEATVETGANRCELRVRDNGIGFEEKYTDRIFDVFQRLHGRGGQYEGTGIGLAICRKIAERHGGSIGARSAPGAGATFLVTLPLQQPTSR
jgi:PAS domain S-box-containing protein